MSSVVISGDTSGTVTVTVPAVAGTNTVTIPAVTGTAVIGSSAVSAVGQIPFSTDGTSYTPTAKIVAGTAVASTSGTSIDFTGLPTWVKRITVMFNGVSLSGTSNFLIQLGDSGGIENTGYVSTGQYISGGVGGSNVTSTAGMIIPSTAASIVLSGHMILTLVGSNLWVSSHVGKLNTTASCFGGGDKTLSDTLDRVRITTVNGTDTFDAGSINILYE
jgi:hypothetical protein